MKWGNFYILLSQFLATPPLMPLVQSQGQWNGECRECMNPKIFKKDQFKSIGQFDAKGLLAVSRGISYKKFSRKL